jgi:hypothetical protein
MLPGYLVHLIFEEVVEEVGSCLQTLYVGRLVSDLLKLRRWR